ncbi:hypothetical protein SAMN05192534_10229 [Alteribacillus persepolensis]|uniref:Uncharacterized protein n=1 Tax=Alteribacillus persepolensis TaxID=568899 RepID=A0A1G8A5L0_9BACI|nr:hypothetical protein [Alteribacillus persepolensis]SDH16146.1 hypothetical protein SAMN05192534_10229 [Alteribacillus persepolensis]
MKKKNQPPKNNPAEESMLSEFPVPQEQVADPFVEGTEAGAIEEEHEPDLPPDEEQILESENDV